MAQQRQPVDHELTPVAMATMKPVNMQASCGPREGVHH
jgi:hypothetical protein